MPDPCSELFRPNTKAMCVCRCLASLGTATLSTLARFCKVSRTTVSRVVKALEKEGHVKRVYYNNRAYTIVWNTLYSFFRGDK